MQEWKKLGQILIEHGILTATSFERMLAVSRKDKKRIGLILENCGLVTGEELAAALAQQFGLKVIANLTSYAYSRQVLDLVPSELAIQRLVFPLKLEGNRLLLAVADPTETKFVENLAANNGLQITRCVATRREIYGAICKHYLKQEFSESTTETVLVIDDEATTQALAQEFLAQEGYRVLVANDGLEGFNLLIAQKPHVIITDKVMPKLDGVRLLQSIQAIPEFQAVPVLLMSDKLTPQEEMKVFEMGFFDYIAKPISRIPVVSRVKRAFRHCVKK